MNLIFNDKRFLIKDSLKYFKQITNLVLEYHGINSKNIEISISFIKENEIKKLNFKYRNKNSETDTLSFSQYKNIQNIIEEQKDFKIKRIINIGDIVLCPSVIKKNSEKISNNYLKELCYIYLHSFLHLLSYDHMTKNEKAKMRKVEKIILKKI